MQLFRRKAASFLRHTEVPARVTESFILTGYRFPGSSFLECLVSAFQPTNETGNFWTHFLGVFVFVFHFIELFWWDTAPLFTDPFYYPFWNYFIGVFGLLIVSSMAHLFNSMSLLIREICFFIDYGTISAYTVGSSLAYFYYINPKLGSPTNLTALWLMEEDIMEVEDGSALDGQVLAEVNSQTFFAQAKLWFEVFYVPTACLIALVCTLACCNTRQQWRKYRYIIRTLVFLLPFVVVSIPVFYRLYAGSHSTSTASFFFRHCFWLVISGVFNISKIPERFSPGKFDIWGHSHQWFHCCTFMSILDELHMIKAEIKSLEGDDLHHRPTFLSTFGVMFALQSVIALIVIRFAVQAYAQDKKTKIK